MRLRQLVQDDDAVSPVIGVILMVAITVILAAVIASFVLGLGDQAQQTTPQASFSFDYEKGGGSGSNLANSDGTTGALTITHDGGDTIDSARVDVVDDDSGDTAGTLWSNDLSAGSSITIDVGHDDTIRVIYEGESGDTSSTLATWEAPNA